MHHHRRLQRRVLIGAGVVVLLFLAIAIPLTVNDGLRYDLAVQSNLVPGKDAERLTDEDDGALLVVIPLADPDGGTSPWLYRAQFIAWPNDDGNELENLETGERQQIPLQTIDFMAGSDDGSLVLLRGTLTNSADEAAFTIEPGTMHVEQLPTADATPDEPGNWTTPAWEQVEGMCSRPSPNKRFVGCFTRATHASYLAGDWQLDLQMWGDYEVVKPLYRGRGFLPWVGFAKNDTVVYLQNEYGIVRIEIPDDALDTAPPGIPFGTPMATP